MTQGATLFLAGATLVGGLAIGKAAVDHMLAPRSADTRATDQEEPERDVVKDVVSYLISMASIGYTIYETPKMLASWREYVPAELTP